MPILYTAKNIICVWLGSLFHVSILSSLNGSRGLTVKIGDDWKEYHQLYIATVGEGIWWDELFNSIE